jgi:hypothetical protein
MKTLQDEIIEATLMIIALFLLFALMPAEAARVSFPTNDVFWVAYGPDGTRHYGTTSTNQVTVSGQPEFIQGDSPEELADAGLDAGFADWPEMPGDTEAVERGVYSYGDQTIMVYQSHTRQPDWTIEGTPSLYGVYHGVGTAPAEWVQPLGAHDAYQTGDKVLFNGLTYESVIDANVWSPSVYPAGWEVVE